MFNQISSKLTIMFLCVPFTLLFIHFFLFQFLRWKTVFLHPKRISLPVRHMFNQILSKLTIMFLLIPFTLLLIQFFPISIFKVKNSVFRPKIYISSRLEHVQPNFVKLGNIKYKSLYTYPVYNVLCQVSSLLTITFFQIP